MGHGRHDVVARDIGDELGPSKVVLIREPRGGLEGVVVIDNVACGPAIGGIRMAPDITVDEVARLARAMTYKNAAAGLATAAARRGLSGTRGGGPPRGGWCVPLAHAIRSSSTSRPGHGHRRDVHGLAPRRDRPGGRACPRVIGGIPLDAIGATGFGLAVCAEVAQELPASAHGARMAVQGFGAVGRKRRASSPSAAPARGGLRQPRAPCMNPKGLDFGRCWRSSGRTGRRDSPAAGALAPRRDWLAWSATSGFPPPAPMCCTRATSAGCARS